MAAHSDPFQLLGTSGFLKGRYFSGKHVISGTPDSRIQCVPERCTRPVAAGMVEEGRGPRQLGFQALPSLLEPLDKRASLPPALPLAGARLVSGGGRAQAEPGGAERVLCPFVLGRTWARGGTVHTAGRPRRGSPGCSRLTGKSNLPQSYLG